MTNNRVMIAEAIRLYRHSWKELVLTDVICKVIAFVLLTPLLGIAFRSILSLSGRTILADEDILLFILGPWGWLCMTVVGSLWLGILALEQSALLYILRVAAAGQPVRLVDSLRFAFAKVDQILRVTWRLAAWMLLVAAPFLGVAGLAFVQLLTEYDINYYLTEQPPEFTLALAIGGMIIVAWAATMLHLITNWFFALPLVLFGDIDARNALKVSRENATGQRLLILQWIVGWLVVGLIVSLITTRLVIWIGSISMPYAAGSIKLLMVVIGMTLVLGTVTTLIINLLSTTALAAIVFNLYRNFVDSYVGDNLPYIASASDEIVPPFMDNFRITGKRLVGIGLLGMLIAAGLGFLTMRSVKIEDATVVTAHRGASAAAPENTIAAVKKAIDEGADWIEIDVQETADGEVVIFHDQDFMKLARNQLKIWDATAKDLAEIDIGSWFAPEFREQRVPTLAAVLEECKGRAGVNIELKSYGKNVKLEERVVEIVEAHGMESDIVIMSLNNEMVKHMKLLRPQWKVGLLTSVAIGDLTAQDADFLAVNGGLATRDFIRSAHARNKEVHVWTVNDAVTMSTMIGRRVDNLITDKPALARTVLDVRAKMSVPERLLLELATILGSVPEISDQ